MWSFPKQDQAVLKLYNQYQSQFQQLMRLRTLVNNGADLKSYSAIFIPGGHGAMLGLPEDPQLGQLLHRADKAGLFTISICHGPAALLSTCVNSEQDFIYQGYEMAVFPDVIDKQSPLIGYLPGAMPWMLESKLRSLGVSIKNSKPDDTVCIDRHLITGASPDAADALGRLAVNALLQTTT